MKHFIIDINYEVPIEQVAPHTPDHRAFLRVGYERGLLLISGPKASKTGGFIVARANSQEELEAYFREDPFQVRGIATYSFTAFDPVKRQPFLELWATQEKLES